MTLADLIDSADSCYAESEQCGPSLTAIWKGESDNPDHLARFIIAEIVSAYEAAEGDSDQFQAAVDGLKNASVIINNVADALENNFS